MPNSKSSNSCGSSSSGRSRSRNRGASSRRSSHADNSGSRSRGNNSTSRGCGCHSLSLCDCGWSPASYARKQALKQQAPRQHPAASSCTTASCFNARALASAAHSPKRAAEAGKAALKQRIAATAPLQLLRLARPPASMRLLWLQRRIRRNMPPKQEKQH